MLVFHFTRIRNPFRIYFRDNALRKRRRERNERSHASRSYSSVSTINNNPSYLIFIDLRNQSHEIFFTRGRPRKLIFYAFTIFCNVPDVKWVRQRGENSLTWKTASDSAYRYVACKVGYHATPVRFGKIFILPVILIAYVIFKLSVSSFLLLPFLSLSLSSNACKFCFVTNPHKRRRSAGVTLWTETDL